MEGVLEDGLLTREEENALNRYMDHFSLDTNQLDRNGVLTQVGNPAVYTAGFTFINDDRNCEAPHMRRLVRLHLGSEPRPILSRTSLNQEL